MSAAMLLASAAAAQTQQCTGDPAPAPQFSPSAIVFDLGTCFLFDGGSPTFIYGRSYDIEFGDLFIAGPPTVTLDYSTPDGFTMRYDVTILGGSGAPASGTATFIAAGSGSWTAPLSIVFTPGMRILIVESAAVADENAQCFDLGYYCWHQTKFTLR
jgi:hypothetical protein